MGNLNRAGVPLDACPQAGDVGAEALVDDVAGCRPGKGVGACRLSSQPGAERCAEQPTCPWTSRDAQLRRSFPGSGRSFMPTTASSAAGDPVQGFGHLGVWTVHGTGQVPHASVGVR